MNNNENSVMHFSNLNLAVHGCTYLYKEMLAAPTNPLLPISQRLKQYHVDHRRLFDRVSGAITRERDIIDTL